MYLHFKISLVSVLQTFLYWGVQFLLFIHRISNKKLQMKFYFHYMQIRKNIYQGPVEVLLGLCVNVRVWVYVCKYVDGRSHTRRSKIFFLALTPPLSLPHCLVNLYHKLLSQCAFVTFIVKKHFHPIRESSFFLSYKIFENLVCVMDLLSGKTLYTWIHITVYGLRIMVSQLAVVRC